MTLLDASFGAFLSRNQLVMLMFCMWVSAGMKFSLRPPTEGRECLYDAGVFGGIDAGPESLAVDTNLVQTKESSLRMAASERE